MITGVAPTYKGKLDCTYYCERLKVRHALKVNGIGLCLVA